MLSATCIVAADGANARPFEPSTLGPMRIRLLDGAVTGTYLT